MDVVIAGAVRTAIRAVMGALAPVPATMSAAPHPLPGQGIAMMVERRANTA